MIYECCRWAAMEEQVYTMGCRVDSFHLPINVLLELLVY